MSDFWFLSKFAVITLVIALPILPILFRFTNVRRNYTISDRKEALIIGVVLALALGFLMSSLVSFLLVALAWGVDPGGFFAFVAFAFKISLAVMLLVVPPLWLMTFVISFMPPLFARPEGDSS